MTLPSARSATKRRVVFACVHNAGRSQMAAAFFNTLVDRTKARAVSAGTTPAPRVHPGVVTAMDEVGIDLHRAMPHLLTPEVAAGSHLLITMGCADKCPIVPGVQRLDWTLPDPAGVPLVRVREIRDEIRARVAHLVAAEGWGRNRP